MQCPPRKEIRSPSGWCVHRAASSRTYCRPDKREGLKKTQATTSKAFWAAGNRRAGAYADSRLHCLPGPHETQPSNGAVRRLPSAVRGQHSRRNDDCRANDQGEKCKLERRRIASENDLPHWSLELEGLPKISMDQLSQVTPYCTCSGKSSPSA
jgi:hypothetical protein